MSEEGGDGGEGVATHVEADEQAEGIELRLEIALVLARPQLLVEDGEGRRRLALLRIQ